MTESLPQDLKISWINVARRLQSVARGCRGNCAIITISVVADASGNALWWFEPQRREIEPKSMCQDDIVKIFKMT